MSYISTEIGKSYKIGSEDWNDIIFCGQRIKWVISDDNRKEVITVDQERGIDDLVEVIFNTKLDDELDCDSDLHPRFRSVVGAVNWLQSRTQYQAAYGFSRCASKLAKPKIKDLKEITNLYNASESIV